MSTAQLAMVRNRRNELSRFWCSDEFFFSQSRENVLYWQADLSRIQQGWKSGKWMKVEITAVMGFLQVCDHVSGKQKQVEKTVEHLIWKKLLLWFLTWRTDFWDFFAATISRCSWSVRHKFRKKARDCCDVPDCRDDWLHHGVQQCHELELVVKFSVESTSLFSDRNLERFGEKSEISPEKVPLRQLRKFLVSIGIFPMLCKCRAVLVMIWHSSGQLTSSRIVDVRVLEGRFGTSVSNFQHPKTKEETRAVVHHHPLGFTNNFRRSHGPPDSRGLPLGLLTAPPLVGGRGRVGIEIVTRGRSRHLFTGISIELNSNKRRWWWSVSTGWETSSTFSCRCHERHRNHQFQPLVVQEPDSEIVEDVDRLGSFWSSDHVSEYSHMHFSNMYFRWPTRSHNHGATKSREWPLKIATKEGESTKTKGKENHSASCHQKQVIHKKMLWYSRNLQMTWTMPLGRRWNIFNKALLGMYPTRVLLKGLLCWTGHVSNIKPKTSEKEEVATTRTVRLLWKVYRCNHENQNSQVLGVNKKTKSHWRGWFLESGKILRGIVLESLKINTT